MSETPTDHEHDLVWVTSPDMEQARQYCRECGYRSEWVDLPPELAPGGPGDDDYARRLEDDQIELDRTR